MPTSNVAAAPQGQGRGMQFGNRDFRRGLMNLADYRVPQQDHLKSDPCTPLLGHSTVQVTLRPPTTVTQTSSGLLDDGLAFGVQGACGLVQHQDPSKSAGKLAALEHQDAR